MNTTEMVVQTEQVVEQVAKKSSMTPVIVVAVFFAVIIIGGLIFGLILMQRQKENGGTGAGEDKDGKGESKEENKSGGGEKVVILDTKRLVQNVEAVEEGIIVTDGGKRFVAAITCRGMDFYNESSMEQLSIMNGYQEFLNIATKPMTYRLYSKAVDIDVSKERYTEKYRETMAERDLMVKEQQMCVAKGLPEDVLGYIQGEINRCEHRMKHLEAQMHYMDFYSSTDVVMDLTQDYIFDWTYEAGIADAKLTPSEIFKKAKAELYAIAGQKITALSAAGVKARMCTNDEVLDAFRRNSKPITAEEYKQRVVRNSSFNEDIVSSDSIDNVVASIKQDFLEELDELADNGYESVNNRFSIGGNDYGDEE